MIFEIINKGKGLIDSLLPANLLEIRSAVAAGSFLPYLASFVCDGVDLTFVLPTGAQVSQVTVNRVIQYPVTEWEAAPLLLTLLTPTETDSIVVVSGNY